MKKKGLSIMIGLAFFFNSCNDDKGGTSENVSLTLTFTHSWAGTEITKEDFDDIKFTNESGQKLGISRLRYLVSEVRLTHNNGTETVLDGYNLVDVTNQQGLTFTLSEGIIAGNYKDVAFRFGFSDEKNIDGAYADLNTASFNVPGENSAMNLGGGYHYMQFDGKYINNQVVESPFNYHMIRAIDMMNNESKDTSFEVGLNDMSINENTEIVIDMDVSDWFKNPNTWDLNEYNTNLMGNYDAQLLMKQNGASVFKLVSVTP